MDRTWSSARKWRVISLFIGVSLVVFGMFLSPITARNQAGGTGPLTGTVRDSSGAPVSGARVTVTKTDNNLATTDSSQTMVSATDGSFTFPALPRGPYRIDVKKDGFAPYQQILIGLVVGHSAQITVNLQPLPRVEGNATAPTWLHPDEGLVLPPYVRRVAYFEERPDWSLDGKRLIFIEKTFGDVFEVDLATGVIRSITDHYFHAGYSRALYLANGDVLLSGARDFSASDPWSSRKDKAELWVLDKNFDKPAVPLGERCYEGPAVSRTNMRIAWTVQHSNYPDRIPQGGFEFWMADIQSVNGAPTIANKKKILDSTGFPHRMETQNFRPPLAKEQTDLTFGGSAVGLNDVMDLNLETGKLTDYTGTTDLNEPEGMFPDNQYEATESNRAHPGLFAIDIWKLKLDGSNQAERLTYLTEGGKFNATNPVVSDDGKYMAFELAVNGDATGVGHGILVYDFAAAKKYFAEHPDAAKAGGNDAARTTRHTP